MTIDTVEQFKEKIAQHLNLKLDLVVNENRSTMLSILERKRDQVRLSLHRMFLDAPEHVITAIAHYIRGTKRERYRKDLVIRGYIQSNLSRFNYQHQLDKEKLVTVGKTYDLQKIYRELNRIYFDNRLQLEITWFGRNSRKKRRTRIIFGQYYDHLKLIKIHRMIDHPFFPFYFVQFVVYHEMLHEVVPGYVDERGIFRAHGTEFKRLEKQFIDYTQAVTWEKENKKYLFTSNYSG